jgi:hypothetical protein
VLAARSAGYRYGNTMGNVQNPFLNYPTSQRHFPPYQNLTAIRATYRIPLCHLIVFRYTPAQRE